MIFWITLTSLILWVITTSYLVYDEYIKPKKLERQEKNKKVAKELVKELDL